MVRLHVAEPLRGLIGDVAAGLADALQGFLEGAVARGRVGVRERRHRRRAAASRRGDVPEPRRGIIGVGRVRAEGEAGDGVHHVGLVPSLRAEEVRLDRGVGRGDLRLSALGDGRVGVRGRGPRGFRERLAHGRSRGNERGGARRELLALPRDDLDALARHLRGGGGGGGGDRGGGGGGGLRRAHRRVGEGLLGVGAAAARVLAGGARGAGPRGAREAGRRRSPTPAKRARGSSAASRRWRGAPGVDGTRRGG